MATKNTYWIKMYTGLLDNPKFMKLEPQTKWHYVALYLLAKKSDAFGWLIFDDVILSIEDMAYQLHEDEEELKKSITKLIEVKLLYYTDENAFVISGYEEQQQNDQDSEYGKRVREQSRKRQEKHRAKVKIEKEIEEKKEKEKNRIEEEKEEEKEKNRIEGHVINNVTVTLQDSESYSLDSDYISNSITNEETSYKQKVKDLVQSLSEKEKIEMANQAKLKGIGFDNSESSEKIYNFLMDFIITKEEKIPF